MPTIRSRRGSQSLSVVKSFLESKDYLLRKRKEYFGQRQKNNSNDPKIRSTRYSLLGLIKICPFCQGRFKPTRKESIYCSVKCGKRATRRTGDVRICRNCGKDVYRNGSALKDSKRTFCSQKCMAINQKVYFLGKNNPNWKGGRSSAKSSISGQNKSYKKGKYYERKTWAILEKEGFYVMRSGGSRGLVDLIAFNNDSFRLIQVKSGVSFMSATDKKALTILKAPNNCSKELWEWKEGKEPKIIIF